MIAYLDTSAALRLLVAGPAPDAARLAGRTKRYLDQLAAQRHALVASTLLRAEVLCQANRQPEIDVPEAERLLARVNLIDLAPDDLENAPSTPGQLRTLDAIHLTVALRVGADVFVAYDDELLRAARAAGLRTGPDRTRRGRTG